MELLPHRCSYGLVLVVKVLEKWQFLETYPLEARELMQNILPTFVDENFLEVVAEQDVKCLETW
jgi:hypothetical protein